MNNTNVGIRLDYFQNLLTVFLNDLANRNQFFLRYTPNNKTLPVYLESTGDMLYRLERESMIEERLTKSYEMVPRIVCNVSDFSLPSDGRSVSSEPAEFSQWIMGNESKWNAPIQLIGFEINVNATVVMPNFLVMMSYIQYLNEAFGASSYPVMFEGLGNESEAVYSIDVSRLNPSINHSMSPDGENEYPTIELGFTIKGKYPNFNYYDLETGYHGYNGTNHEAITDPSESDNVDGNGDLISSSNRITKVILNLDEGADGSIDETIEYE